MMTMSLDIVKSWLIDLYKNVWLVLPSITGGGLYDRNTRTGNIGDCR